MAIPLTLQKATFQHFLDCIADGRPITGTWNINELLTLAGTCLYAAMTHGPALRPGVQSPLEEHREVHEDQLVRELHAAVDFCLSLADKVRHGEYDAEYGPTLKGLLSVDGDGKVLIAPAEGFHGEGT